MVGLYTIRVDGSEHFDWDAIRARAATKYSASASPAETTTITDCRLMLIGRHEGWKAGVGQPADAVDPYPPEPMMRPEDMR